MPPQICALPFLVWTSRRTVPSGLGTTARLSQLSALRCPRWPGSSRCHVQGNVPLPHWACNIFPFSDCACHFPLWLSGMKMISKVTLEVILLHAAEPLTFDPYMTTGWNSLANLFPAQWFYKNKNWFLLGHLAHYTWIDPFVTKAFI